MKNYHNESNLWKKKFILASFPVGFSPSWHGRHGSRSRKFIACISPALKKKSEQEVETALEAPGTIPLIYIFQKSQPYLLKVLQTSYTEPSEGNQFLKQRRLQFTFTPQQWFIKAPKDHDASIPNSVYVFQ